MSCKDPRNFHGVAWFHNTVGCVCSEQVVRIASGSSKDNIRTVCRLCPVCRRRWTRTLEQQRLQFQCRLLLRSVRHSCRHFRRHGTVLSTAPPSRPRPSTAPCPRSATNCSSRRTPTRRRHTTMPAIRASTCNQLQRFQLLRRSIPASVCCANDRFFIRCLLFRQRSTRRPCCPTPNRTVVRCRRNTDFLDLSAAHHRRSQRCRSARSRVWCQTSERRRFTNCRPLRRRSWIRTVTTTFRGSRVWWRWVICAVSTRPCRLIYLVWTVAMIRGATVLCGGHIDVPVCRTKRLIFCYSAARVAHSNVAGAC